MKRIHVGHVMQCHLAVQVRDDAGHPAVGEGGGQRRSAGAHPRDDGRRGERQPCEVRGGGDERVRPEADRRGAVVRHAVELLWTAGLGRRRW